tara:strand:- start:1213 stop:1758 length:546 start_codon:yes stop_codon:yes gene_type:complete
MVKNQKGGNKSKKLGRKFISATVDRRLRYAQEDGEIYGVVTKLLGNGMFYINDCDGNERLVVMRNKFKGRGKRDNTVILGGWVLVGEREFESCAHPKCDLLEVYNDGEKQRLKNSGDPLFSKLKSDYDNIVNESDESEVLFTNVQENEALLQEIKQGQNDNKTVLMNSLDEEEEEIDVDDI